MKKNGFILTIIVLLLCLNIGCLDKPEEKKNKKASFEIYLLKNTRTVKALNADINTLEIESKPILTDRDIEKYDYKLLQIKIKDSKKISENIKNSKVPLDGKPFVVICNGKRIYVGAFWTAISSLFFPECPTILIDFFENNTLKISASKEKTKLVNDKIILDTFKDLKKLK